MEKIGNSAFEECISLMEVYYEGNEEKWDSLNENYFNNGNESLVYAYVNFETEDLPEVFYDCDGDGCLTTTDMSILKLLLSGIDEYYIRYPDINFDGELNTLDLAILKLMLVGIK
jgi:hypothetical protein